MKFTISLLNFRPGRIGGTETYLRELLKYLPTCAGDGSRFVAVMGREVARVLPTPGIERIVVDCSDRQLVAERTLEAFTPYRAVTIERAFAQIGADATLFPQQSIFPKRVAGPAVVTVHDVQHLILPENVGLADRAFRRAIYPYSLKRASRLIAISNYTRNTLVGRCSVTDDKITVIPHGVRPIDANTLATRELDKELAGQGNVDDRGPRRAGDGPYLYYPAATNAHKNHATLLRSFAALRRSGRIRQKLVFSGEQTATWQELIRLIDSLGIAKDVVHVGFVTSEEVQRLYRGADAIVFPTRFEGFGIPILEATQLGAKIIVSRLEVFDELGVPQQHQIDFGDPEALLRALALPGPTVLEKPFWRWSDAARATVAVLREVGATSASASPRGLDIRAHVSDEERRDDNTHVS